MESEGVEFFDRLPLKYAYQFLSENGHSEKADEIRLSKDRFKSYTSTLRRAKIVNFLDEKGLLNNFIEKYWENGNTLKGQNQIKGLRRLYESYLNGSDVEEDEVEEEIEGTSFAYEEDLKNYLVSNLSIIEPGLHLYQDEKGVDGVEFPIDPNNKRVDILAVDRNGTPVVIELKVSRGYEKVIGQCLYYKNRVKKIINSERVRIIIIAREISQNLKTAIEDLPGVQLFEYKLSVRLEPV
jgi:hypothetical protein